LGQEKIMKNFWDEVKHKKPFFALAPMADVTDAAFRQLIAKYSRHGEEGGGPDIFWTEFVSANGLASRGKEALMYDLKYTENERPILAQLFTADPKNMEESARLVQELGFDGLDINMGCPDRTIEKQGAGACMIKTPDIAKEIIRAAKRGAPNLPISVKTRVGYNQVEIDTWIPALLEEGLAALTVHVRTRKEMSSVPADWGRLKKVVALRDKISPHTLIIGNGDVLSLADGEEKAKETGADGIMVGRAIFGNPWFFDKTRSITAALPKKHPLGRVPIIGKFFETKHKGAQSKVRPITVKERLDVMLEHAKLFDELLGEVKSFSIMKKHFKAYVTGWPGAKELRMKLMESKNVAEVEEILAQFKL
jgi:tRNA-dihydrouridine synthase